jgi:co-chaperonin GroES (HSP10)
MTDTYVTDDGVAARVLGNNLLVRPDPEPTATRGGIIVPGLGNDTLHHTGVVVAVGYLTGKRAPHKTPIPDIAVGDHIVFVRLLALTDSNPQIKRILDDNVLRIRPSDVLLVIDKEDLNRLP